MKRFTSLRFAWVAAGALLVAGQASATFNWFPKPAPEPSDDCVVKAYADDKYQPTHADGSWKDPMFWGIDFREGCDEAFIKSVTIDLQAGYDNNAYFDLSGGAASNNAFGPVIGDLNGMSASDVTFSPETGDSRTLTISFADGAFKVGDSIYFGADTDNLGNNGAADVGLKAVGFSVTFGNGVTYSTSFAKYSYSLSKAKIEADDCCGTLIPTPSAVGLGMVMLCGLGARRRRTSED